MRFCLRMDLSPSSFGSCQVEELKGSEPSPCDILLVTKRRMADHSPTHVMCVLSAQEASNIRHAFEQPSGVSPRRAISQQVVTNISVYAPRCQEQGIINADGATYLLAWSRGEWESKSRPRSYSFLHHRPQSPLDGVPAFPRSWQKPRRVRTFDVSARGDESETASEEEEERVPIQLG